MDRSANSPKIRPLWGIYGEQKEQSLLSFIKKTGSFYDPYGTASNLKKRRVLRGWLKSTVFPVIS